MESAQEVPGGLPYVKGGNTNTFRLFYFRDYWPWLLVNLLLVAGGLAFVVKGSMPAPLIGLSLIGVSIGITGFRFGLRQKKLERVRYGNLGEGVSIVSKDEAEVLARAGGWTVLLSITDDAAAEAAKLITAKLGRPLQDALDVIPHVWVRYRSNPIEGRNGATYHGLTEGNNLTIGFHDGILDLMQLYRLVRHEFGHRFCLAFKVPDHQHHAFLRSVGIS